MLDNGLSADQVRSAAGVTFQAALVACYLAAAASSGLSLAEVQSRTGMERAKCRSEAFRWGIQFSDYDPFAAPKRLEWRKVKLGWELLDGSDCIGACQRDEDGRYTAKLFSATKVTNWNARKAMTLLSVELDAMSSDLPGLDGRPIRVVVSNKDGLVEQILFGDGDEYQGFRDALQFRTVQKLGIA